MNFWVLEIISLKDFSLADWCQRTLRTLNRHRTSLLPLLDQGAKLTLFLHTEGCHGVLRLETSFVRSLADLNMAFEHHHYLEDT